MSADIPVPPSLQREDLHDVWQAVRAQLDRHGLEHRGTIAMPTLGANAQLSLASLLGGPLRARLDLTALESALQVQNLGVTLDDALTKLGAPPSDTSLEKRRRKQIRFAAKEAVSDRLALWVEPWASEYGGWLFSSGQMVDCDTKHAMELVENVQQLLDAVARAAPGTLARNDLAVSLFGSSHALDDGVLLERCARRALWLQVDGTGIDYRQGREVWQAAGVRTDRVSAPVLVWRLPLIHNSALGTLTTAADAAAVPIHLTEIAMQSHPLEFAACSSVLLVENPRLAEYAAERGLEQCVISTNGNPSGAVMRLINALLETGIDINHHGDFDSAGIGICRRLQKLGCTPWRMSSSDYLWALRFAEQKGLQLPTDVTACGVTPWDVGLEAVFDERRLVVHEELLMGELFEGL